MQPPLFLSELSPLYEAVQSSGIFPDSKFFPDCIPLSDISTILSAYEVEKTQAGFDLKNFITTHFAAPATPDSDYHSASRPIREHLDGLWSVLTRQPVKETGRSSLLPLPRPYIVPGGRFREVYYWDSYFTMLGLRESGRFDMIENMVDNFAHQIYTCGHIPNGNRSYYLSRSQPPFFALMVDLLAEIKGENVWSTYRKALQMEHDFWMEGEDLAMPVYRRVCRMDNGALLNRYWDDDPAPRPEAYVEDVHTAGQADRPATETWRHLRAAAESGWDFSSRWLADERYLHSIRTCELVPADLNCLLYYLEQSLSRCAETEAEKRAYAERAEQRRKAILQYCMDAGRGFFFDYDLKAERCADALTLAGIYPLFFKIADDKQAALAARVIAENFLCEGGLRTSTVRSGQQWDAPNGWAPLQWMAYQGLLNYGHHELAREIQLRWCALCEKTYAETGKMMEKYDVENPGAPGGGGEYPNQDGFGWTNGVYLALRAGIYRD
jgi:alpha,alpha-trehalase